MDPKAEKKARRAAAVAARAGGDVATDAAAVAAVSEDGAHQQAQSAAPSSNPVAQNAGPAKIQQARPPAAAVGKKVGAPGADKSGKSQAAGKQPAAPVKAAEFRPATVSGFSHILHNAAGRQINVSALANLHTAFKAAASELTSSLSSTSVVTAAILRAIQQFVCDFQRAQGSALARELDKAITSQLELLQSIVSFTPAIANAVRAVRSVITRLPPDVEDAAAKSTVAAAIEQYLSARVAVIHSIASSAASRIGAGSTVLVYGQSAAAVGILAAAAAQHPGRVSAIVVDARPHMTGQGMAARVAKAGVTVSYTTLAGIAAALPRCTCTLLGAAAVFGDGSVLGWAGQAVVALLASQAGLPVYVAAETYKFTDRTVSDSIALNELAPLTTVATQSTTPVPWPASASSLPASAPVVAPTAGGGGGGGGKCKGKDAPPLVVPYEDSGSWRANGQSILSTSPADPKTAPRLLPLLRDTTPGSVITGFFTEAGHVPSHCVPVVLREIGRREAEAGQQPEEDFEDDEEGGSSEEDGSGEEDSGSEEDS